MSYPERTALHARNLSALLLLALSFAGCAEFDLRRKIPWGIGQNGNLDPPKKVVALWEPTVMNQPNQKGIRGFGGRVLFYEREDGKPVKVKGTLNVYAYDEDTRESTVVAPSRKFVFESEDLKNHYKKCALGHSYNFWLPFEDADGMQKHVSLICRFTSDDGEVVVGEQAHVMLPGLPRDPSLAAQSKLPLENTVKQISHTEPAGDSTATPESSEKPKAEIQTATIRMPLALLRHQAIGAQAQPADSSKHEAGEHSTEAARAKESATAAPSRRVPTEAPTTSGEPQAKAFPSAQTPEQKFFTPTDRPQPARFELPKRPALSAQSGQLNRDPLWSPQSLKVAPFDPASARAAARAQSSQTRE